MTASRKQPGVAREETGFIEVQGVQVPFSVERSRKRRRTIAFQMEQDGVLRVMAPVATSLHAVRKVAQAHAPWVARRLAERAAAPPQCDFSDGSVFPYLGHACTLRVTVGGEGPGACRLTRRVWHVRVPDAALSPQGVREETRLEIVLALKKRARVVLKRRLDLWAARLGVRYRCLIVADPDRRWGSCTVDDEIRLHWRLLAAPLSVLDYVVAHELCHVRHKDHSPRFWAFLESVMPDWRARRKWLRKNEANLMF